MSNMIPHLPQNGPNFAIEGTVVQMLLDDIKDMKMCLKEHASGESAEFRRIYDRIDALDESIREEMKDNIVDIATLKEKMRIASWLSGGVAGVIVNAILMYVQTLAK